MKYLQSNNDRKFRNVLFVILRRHEIRVINDRLKHFQSQNFIEQINDVVKNRLNT